ncbi:hypothetical protein pb186bvf_007278 [Paramecium bursaria]
MIYKYYIQLHTIIFEGRNIDRINFVIDCAFKLMINKVYDLGNINNEQIIIENFYFDQNRII